VSRRGLACLLVAAKARGNFRRDPEIQTPLPDIVKVLSNASVLVDSKAGVGLLGNSFLSCLAEANGWGREEVEERRSNDCR